VWRALVGGLGLIGLIGSFGAFGSFGIPTLTDGVGRGAAISNMGDKVTRGHG
jgi:hypothetical protein